MLTRTIKVKDRMIEIPGLEKYKGKLVEITVKEKRKVNRKKKYTKFFSLCGKIDLNEEKLEGFREQSMI